MSEARTAIGEASESHDDLDAAPGVLARLMGWVPLMLALGLSAVFVVRGLVPARAEARRLAPEQPRLQQNVGMLETEAAELRSLLLAHQDPIYIERERRMLRTLAPPATPIPEALAPSLRAGTPIGSRSSSPAQQAGRSRSEHGTGGIGARSSAGDAARPRVR